VCALNATNQLLDLPVLIIDCQTTGANPRHSYLLELGWMFATAASAGPIQTSLIALPEGEELPGRIQKITGITAEEMLLAEPAKSVIARLKADGIPPMAVAHYAKFEQAFLDDFFKTNSRYKTLPFSFICTCEIAKRLYPDLPSRAIRALVGYFGLTIGEMKRASCHVEATYHIWKKLVGDLSAIGVNTPAELESWLAAPKPKKVARAYELPMERLKRLELPAKPGVYHMLSSSGQILYVGKATSLRDRVNSYFRGRKGKDSKTKELISQIFDIRIEVLETPLEAALRETDLIKQHDPPYNRALREKGRHLTFFSRDFSSWHLSQSAENYLGPFPSDSLKPLLQLAACLKDGTFDESLFWGLVEEQMGLEALAAFLEAVELNRQDITVRRLLALGMVMLRQEIKARAEAERLAAALLNEGEAEISEAGEAAEVEDEDESEDDAEEDDEHDEHEMTVEEAVQMLCGTLVRSARLLRQARELTALLNSEITFVEQGKQRTLLFENGRQVAAVASVQRSLSWSGLEIDTYDRMRVLATEMTRLARSAKVIVGMRIA
jgi:DNA polymerase III subunit epsilon